MTGDNKSMAGKAAATSYDMCLEQVRQQDPDRYTAALYAGDKNLPLLIALLALHHELAHSRDDVNEAMIGDIRLAWWRESLDGIFSQTPRKHPVVELLADISQDRILDRQDLEAMIDGRAACDDPEKIQTWQDLEDWIEATSMPLALSYLGAMDLRDEMHRSAARHVALGYGLVGMARSIPALASRGKCMLPRQELESLGLVTESILRGKSSEELRVLVSDMLDMADGHLAEARKYRGKLSSSALPVLLPARIADHHIRALRKQGCDPWNPVHMGSLRKQLRLARAWVTRRF